MKSSCSTLFICTALLCSDKYFFNTSFFNIIQCNPSLDLFNSNLQLIPLNKNFSATSNHGFICSNCSQKNFFRYYINQENHCLQERTVIELRNYCSTKQTTNSCQCYPSNQPIKLLTDWVKPIVDSGKSHMNIIRTNNINKSSSKSVYILISSIIFLVIFGGIIGMIFYSIKFKQLQTLK